MESKNNFLNKNNNKFLFFIWSWRKEKQTESADYSFSYQIENEAEIPLESQFIKSNKAELIIRIGSLQITKLPSTIRLTMKEQTKNIIFKTSQIEIPFKDNIYLFKVRFNNCNLSKPPQSVLSSPEELLGYIDYCKKINEPLKPLIKQAENQLKFENDCFFELFLTILIHSNVEYNDKEKRDLFEQFDYKKCNRAKELRITIEHQTFQSFYHKHDSIVSNIYEETKFNMIQFYSFYYMHYNRNELCSYIEDVLNVHKECICSPKNKDREWAELTHKEIVEICLHLCNDNKKIEKVINMAKDIDELLLLFNHPQCNQFLKSYTINTFLLIDYHPKEFNQTELDKLIQLYDIIITKGNNIELNQGGIVEEFRLHYEKTKDLKGLLSIKNYLDEIKIKKPSKDIETLISFVPDIIESAYCTIGFQLIQNRVIQTNEDIIEILVNISLQNSYISHEKIIQNISIEDLNEPQLILLQKYNLNPLVSKITNWTEVEHLLLLNESYQFLMNNNMFELLYKKFVQLFSKIQPETDPIENIIDYLNNYCIKQRAFKTQLNLFKSMEEKIVNDNLFINYIQLIVKVNRLRDNRNADLQKLITSLIQYFLSKTEKKFELLSIFLSKTNFEIHYLFFNRLNKYFFTKIDFFEPEDSKSVVLFKQYKELGYLNLNTNPNRNQIQNQMMKTSYGQYINRITKEIKSNIELKKLSNKEIGQYILLQKKNKLKERTELIASHEEAIKLSDIINAVIKDFLFLRQGLDTLIEYYRFYEISNVNDISKLDSFHVLFMTANFDEISKGDKIDIDFLKNKAPLVEKFNEIKKSHMFLMIYNSILLVDNIKKRDESVKVFNLLSDLFIGNKINDFDLGLLFAISTDLQNMDFIIRELNLVRKLLNITVNVPDSQIQSIAHKLFLFYHKGTLIDGIKEMFLFINESHAKQTDVYDTIKTLIDKETLSFEYLESIHQFFMKFNININDKSRNCLVLLSKFYRRIEFLTFMWKLNDDNVRLIIEFYDILDTDTELRAKNILDLNNVFNFTKRIKNKSNKTDKEVISHFVALSLKEQFNSLPKYLDSVISEFTLIKELCEKNMNKEHFIIEKLREICVFCLIDISYRDDCYSPIIEYRDKTHKKRTIQLSELIEIKDRLLIVSKNDQSHDNSIINQYRFFPQLVIKLVALLNFLNELIVKGYAIFGTYSLTIDDSTITLIQTINGQAEKITMDAALESLNNELKLFSVSQSKGYDAYPLLTFVFGRQFQKMVSLIQNYSQPKDLNQLKHFFNYITSDSILNIKIENKKQYAFKSHSQTLTSINQFITNVLCDNGENLHSIYSSNVIINPSIISQSITKFLTSKEIAKELLIIYQLICNNLPLPQTTLLCNESTSHEEIKAFVYRALKCPFQVLFTILNSDILPLAQREVLLSTISEICLASDGSSFKMNSALIVFYENKSSDLIAQIEKLPQYTYHKLILNETSIPTLKSIEVVYSDFCGEGKSRLIKEEFTSTNGSNSYIYFPLGGEMERGDVVNRLLKIIINPQVKYLIHLDLFETKQGNFISDFMFSFLLLKYYYKNENIFYLTDNIEIKVELPSGFYNFIEKFPLLTLFNKRKITIDNNPLIISSDLNSHFQIAMNYLKHIKKLPEFDLSFSSDQTPTSIKAEVLTLNECKEIINQYIRIKRTNYYQLNSFVNLLGSQVKYITNNIYININDLMQIEKEQNKQGLPALREKIVEWLIDLTHFLIENEFNELLKKQNSTYRQQEYVFNESAVIEKAIANLTTEVEHFIESNSSPRLLPSVMLFFNEDKQTISIITTASKQSIVYMSLKQLWNRDKVDPYYTKGFFGRLFSHPGVVETDELIDYQFLSAENFLVEVKKVFNLRINVKNDTLPNESLNESLNETLPNESLNVSLNETQNDKRISTRNMSVLNASCLLTNVTPSLTDIVKSYVFTLDNFRKMLLIMLKFRAVIPVILMGETGCGKTLLIHMMAKLSHTTLKMLNIHAGINDKDIIQFMNNTLRDIDIDRGNDQSSNRNKTRNKENTVWIFFDEINTCHSMGLISEIMLKRTMEGMKLPDNIRFIAACNPYRTGSIKKNEIGLNYKASDYTRPSNLVYKVNPMPYCLLNFVFNFGSLTEDDEAKYIISMLKQPGKTPSDKQKMTEAMIILAKEGIVQSQKFVRKRNGNASVSLREVRRFIILYNWFVNFLYYKKQLQFRIEGSNFSYSSLNNSAIQTESVILALFICYFLRLTIKEHIKEYLDEMDKLFDKGKFNLTTTRETNELVDHINIPSGIARNTALLNNLFTMFVCVNTRIPLIICGKPGSSKSLCVHLLFNAMKGNQSMDNLLKNYGRLYLNSFQGSLSSTSQGLLSIFKKAQNIITENSKDKENVQLISMIFFDEMGLAEKSKNNPLKVIHSQLEYDDVSNLDFDVNNRIAFVGISNYTFDASKMNRCVYLAIPESNSNELIQTGETIAMSYDGSNRMKQYLSLFNTLSNTYLQYKMALAINYDLHKEFHGSRDYYYLIKTVAMKLNNSHKDNVNITSDGIKKIVEQAIERNFGGLEFSMKLFKTQFNSLRQVQLDQESYDPQKCIEQNLSDIEGRFLLLIASYSQSMYLVNTISSNFKDKRSYFLIGSQFSEDHEKEYYSALTLQKIQRILERGDLMVLKHLDIIYPSLYDLFNQNFSFSSTRDKKYCRIALGSTNNAHAEVNIKFRCVIILNPAEVKQQDPPFLNRFEKHLLSVSNIIGKEKIEQAIEIQKTIFLLTEPSTNAKMKMDLTNQLINCYLEEIQVLLMHSNANNENDRFNEVLMKVIPTLPQDIIAFINQSKFKQTKKSMVEKVMGIYKKSEHRNIMSLIKNMSSKKNIVYTYSNIMVPVTLLNQKEITSNLIGKINLTNINEFQISKAKSEMDLEKLIQLYYCNNHYSVCVIKLQLEDCIHLQHLQFLIDNYENSIDTKEQKAFIIIIHLDRDKLNRDISNSRFISHLSEYNQTFIDNINGRDILINDFIAKTNKELVTDKTIFDVPSAMKKCLYNSYMKFGINFAYGHVTQYIQTQINGILENEDIQTDLINCFMRYIIKQKPLITTIYTNEVYEKGDGDFISIINRYQENILTSILAKILFKFEKDNAFHMMFQSDYNHDVDFIWKKYLDTIDLSLIKGNINNHQVQIIKGLNVPCSKIIFEQMHKYLNKSRKDYFLLEETLRDFFSTTEERDETIANFFKEEERIILIAHNDIIKDPEGNHLFQAIVNSTEGDKCHLISGLLLDDYITKLIVLNYNTKNIQAEKLIKLMISLRFKDIIDQDPYVEMIRKLIWIEANLGIIKAFIQIFLDVFKSEDCLFALINYVISNKEIKYEISERNPEYQRKVNEVFYLILEAVLYCSFKNTNIIMRLSHNEFSDYINTLRSIVVNSSMIECNIRFFSKKKIFIQFITELHLLLSKKLASIQSHLKEIILMENEETEAINSNNADKVCELIVKEIQYVSQLIGDGSDGNKLLINYLIGKYKKYYNDDYRRTILGYILKNNGLIAQSKNLLQLYFTITFYNSETKDFTFDQSLKCSIENVNLLNKTIKRSKTLQGILLFIFKSIINNAFIQDHNLLSKDDSVEQFKLSKGYLIKCYNNKQGGDQILFLLAISFVKVYLKYIADYINWSKSLDNVQEYIKLIEGKSKLRKVLLLYMMKLLFKLSPSKEKFVASINKIFLWSNEFDLSSNTEYAFEYFFYSLTYNNQYQQLKHLLERSNNDKGEIISCIKNDIILLYDLTVNLFLSNINDGVNYINNEIQKKFYSLYIEHLLPEKQLNEKSGQLLSLLYNYNIFKTHFDMIINKNSKDELLILLSCFKLCLMCTEANHNTFYNRLFSKDLMKVIDDSYVPGEVPHFNLKIGSSEALTKLLLERNNPDYGEYMCSCGLNYTLDPCGLPAVIYNCLNCNQQIGGTHHKLVEREGHFRVYKDEGQKKNVEERKGRLGLAQVFGVGGYQKMDSMLLSEFKAIIQIEIDQEHKGMTSIPLSYHTNTEITIRGMNQIAYRVLNMMLYSILFIGSKLGFVSEEQIKAKLIEGKSLYELMVINWTIISNLLKEKSINIQIFMNHLYPQLFNTIKSSPNEMTSSDRKTFETNINNIVVDSISNYQLYKDSFFKENNRIMNNKSMIPVIKEESELLDPQTYLYIDYFMYETYPSQADLIHQLKRIPDYQSLYPIITNYFEQNNNISLLQNVLLINPFCNYMIDKYSFLISRNEAHQRTIKSQLDCNTQPLFVSFIQGWDNIKSIAVKYKCRDPMPEKQIRESDCIANCLNDCGEMNYGMYIASAYEKLMRYQNQFIQNVISSNQETNGIAHFLIESLSTTIKIQDATKREVIPIEIQSRDYFTFEDLLFAFSSPKALNDNSADYITYDYKGIENELAGIILPGKRLFDDEQRFVIYAYEAYHGNTTVLDRFNKKYELIVLNDSEKKILIAFCENKSINFDKFLSSLQLLIFYLVDQIKQPTTPVIKIINSLPNIIDINNECKQFFITNESLLIGHLIEIYEEIETLCIDSIIENVNIDYKQTIKEDINKAIIDYFKSTDLVIDKKMFISSLTKFIARYISGKRQDIDLNEKSEVIDYLSQKQDIWPIEILQAETLFETEMEKLKKNVNVKLSQIVPLLNLLKQSNK